MARCTRLSELLSRGRTSVPPAPPSAALHPPAICRWACPRAWRSWWPHIASRTRTPHLSPCPQRYEVHHQIELRIGCLLVKMKLGLVPSVTLSTEARRKGQHAGVVWSSSLSTANLLFDSQLHPHAASSPLLTSKSRMRFVLRRRARGAAYLPLLPCPAPFAVDSRVCNSRCSPDLQLPSDLCVTCVQAGAWGGIPGGGLRFGASHNPGGCMGALRAAAAHPRAQR